MRVALLLYGRLGKYFKELHSHILETIGESHTIDVFYSSDYEPPEKIAEFKELYKPIKCINERIIHANHCTIFPGNIDGYNARFYNLECYYINLMRVFSLMEEYVKETNINYEIVICTRIDLRYHATLQFSHSLTDNTIYIPLLWDYHGGINAMFAIGSVYSIKKYCNIYKHFLYLLTNKLSVPHPENLCLANINYHGLRIERFTLPTQIIRDAD